MLKDSLIAKTQGKAVLPLELSSFFIYKIIPVDLCALL